MNEGPCWLRRSLIPSCCRGHSIRNPTSASRRLSSRCASLREACWGRVPSREMCRATFLQHTTDVVDPHIAILHSIFRHIRALGLQRIKRVTKFRQAGEVWLVFGGRDARPADTRDIVKLLCASAPSVRGSAAAEEGSSFGRCRLPPRAMFSQICGTHAFGGLIFILKADGDRRRLASRLGRSTHHGTTCPSGRESESRDRTESCASRDSPGSSQKSLPAPCSHRAR